MKSAKTLLIADDHPVVRSALRILVKQEGFQRVFEASKGNEVISMIREHRPDVVVLDLVMPEMDGLDVLQRIRDNGMQCQVVVFTSLARTFYQERCMRAGAGAFVSKSSGMEDVLKALRAVSVGYTYFQSLPTVALDSLQRTEKEMIDKLSNRELTICLYLANGLSNKEIAIIMHLSHKTISTYKTRLTEKLNLQSKVHLRDFCKRNHLI
ncbi:response regulator [Pseudomonas migulae]|jgi:two-component system response regulator EvgA|uniref:response regulator n=1 Tax=Pseudomonas migulae TaxID=78543 RepID=UPI0037154366